MSRTSRRSNLFMRLVAAAILVFAGVMTTSSAQAASITPQAALVRLLTVTPIQPAWFASSFLAQLSVTQIRQITARIATEFGPYTGVTAAPDGSYLVRFQHGTASAKIHLDGKGRIDNMALTFLGLTGAGSVNSTPRAALAHLFSVPFIPSSWFAPSFLAQVSAAQIQQSITEITAEFGPYESIAALPHGAYQVRFQDGSATAQIHLDSRDRIDGLLFTHRQFTIATTPGKASSSPTDKAAALDALLTRLSRDHTFSGSVLVALHGRVILGKGYGFADVAHSVQNTINTEFRIGSVSKQFTAMSILQLQEARKLSIHDHLCHYIANCPTAWKPLTLQQLLTHTSGIYDYVNSGTLGPLLSRPTTPDSFIGLLKSHPLDFAPGAHYEYSNSNFFLLAYIVEQVAREPYTAYLQQHIFNPLLLQHTGSDKNHPDPRQHALGYSTWAAPAPYVDMSWFFGAGTLYSTVTDLWHWDQALANDALISKASTADMFAAHATICTAGGGSCLGFDQIAYGYGWSNGTIGGHVVVWHNGEVPGYKAMNAFLPREGITVVVLSNVESSGADDIGVQLVKMVLGLA